MTVQMIAEDSMSMDQASPQCNLELQRLREKFAQELKSALLEVLRLWNAYLFRPSRESLGAVHKKIAALSVSGAGLGFADVSAVAMAMEIKLAGLLETGDKPTDDQLHSLKNLLASLAHTIENLERQPSYVTKPVSEIKPRPAVERVEEIFVASEDVALAGWLAGQIESFGYQVGHCADVGSLAKGLVSHKPAALLMDCAMLRRHPAAIKDMLAASMDGLNATLLLIYGDEDLQSRLVAAKAGAAAYFARPVNVAMVVDKLDSLLSASMSDPYRILIVDDDPTLSKVYELVLREKGWMTQVVNEPLRVLEPLADFNPDLILMDLYMPGVNGPELAAVIRQYEKYVSIPIVYLSMEDDISKQLTAISQGADDFLSKTMRPDHLVAAIESRVRRYRILRSHLSRDGLTGLLNHSNLKIRLENEIIRTRRMGGRLAFAMLDLDHFKQVNDTHGHLVGDKVLKSLAKLLKQRLRVTDLIGRYGGEEFAVILLDVVDPSYAARVMDGIRVAFAEVAHLGERDTFHVTLSCGLATFPEFQDAASITDAADKALYEAKRTGRNRVVLASPDRPRQ